MSIFASRTPFRAVGWTIAAFRDHVDFSASCTAFIAILLSAPDVRAQNTREQQIAQAQADKSGQLGLEGPNRGEQVVVRIMKSPLLSGSGGAFPWFGSVYEGTSFAFGGGYLRRMPRHSEFVAIAGVSVNGSSTVRGSYSAPRFAHDKLEPFVSARWTRAKDVLFYGIGNDSRKENRTGFEFDPSLVSAGLAYQATGQVRVTATFEHVAFETHVANPVLGAPLLPSDSRALRFNGFQTGIAFDSRTSPGYSASGTLLRATTTAYAETENQPFDFRQSELEAVQLVSLVREQFVLAFRALATFSTAGDGSPPLALQPYLGGGTTLRGFGTRRFVDRDRVLLTGEYRWTPSRYLDMALFLDAGQVAPTMDEFGWDRMKTSWGIGARFHGPAFTALRLEFARGSEGSRLIIATGAAF